MYALGLPVYDAVELEARLGPRKQILLHDACETGQLDQMCGLLEALVNPNIPVGEREGRVPLHAAAMNGDICAIWILLLNNADPNMVDDSDRTPLWYAAKTNEIAAVILHPLTEEINEEGSLVPRAIKYGQFDLASILLRDEKTNIRRSKEYSSLRRALKHERKDLAALIVDDATDLEQLLCQAVKKGNADVVQYLLEYRIDLDCEDKKTGQTPLHIAARKGRTKIACWLIANGADVNAKNKDGKSPLYEALERHHFETADELVDADVFESSLHNRFEHDPKVVDFLVSWGVKEPSESTEIDVPEFYYEAGDDSCSLEFSTQYDSSDDSGDTFTVNSDGRGSSLSEGSEHSYA